MKHIYVYDSYRQYLQDAFEERKKTSAWTVRKFAEKVGLGSSSYLRMVIDGKRNLSIDLIFRLASVFDLDERQFEFFEALVLREQSTNERQRNYYSRRVDRIRSENPIESVEYNHKMPRMKWYIPSCMMVLHGSKIDEGIPKIISVLGVEKNHAIAIVNELVRENFLEQTEGIYHVSNYFNYFFDKSSSKASYQDFLKEQLDQSKKFLSKNYSKGKFVSHTFTVLNKKNLEAYTEILKKMLTEINLQSEKEKPNDVMVLNLQMHPVLI